MEQIHTLEDLELAMMQALGAFYEAAPTERIPKITFLIALQGHEPSFELLIDALVIPGLVEVQDGVFLKLTKKGRDLGKKAAARFRKLLEAENKARRN